jgi:CHASE2 domain-containing sensor protein
MCLGVGSYGSKAFSCFFAWILGCILALMGWWTASIPTLAFAGFFSILVAIQEAKERGGNQ